MSTAAAATVSVGDSSRPSWVLLNTYARVGENHNETTADGIGRNGERIRASLVRARPPLPSNLYVHCSGASFGEGEPPYLLSMVNNLILLHVYIEPPSGVPTPLTVTSDFFMYRADPKRPSLKLLPSPQGRASRDRPFGIFPRGADHHYTIASLVPLRSDHNLLSLDLFDSETQIWSRKRLSVDSPQKEFPVEIADNFYRLFSHHTSAVLTLGGTTGWVDLWRGILFCNMLPDSEKQHTLRGVPLPLPLKCTKPDADSCETLGDARSPRGIGFVNGGLKVVEVDFKVIGAHVPHVFDEETGWPRCRTENWTIATWTNKEMSDSYDDWQMDCTLQASDIFLGDHSESELPPVDLQDLFVSHPTVGLNENDSHVIYLRARLKFRHPKSWVLAVDMRDRKVQSVVRSGPLPQENRFIDANYCYCSISE